MSVMLLLLIVEKADDGFLGRVEFNNNLIVEEADTINVLEENLKTVLSETYDLKTEEITFDLQYDLKALFEKLKYLNISNVAPLANVSPGLLRHYVAGTKHPSAKRAKDIENAIHQIGEELMKIKIYSA